MSNYASVEVLIHGFEVTFPVEFETVEQLAESILFISKISGIQPKPRFQRNDAPKFAPFTGKVVKTETTKKMMGTKEREVCLATLEPDKATWPDAPDTFVVQYWPPQKTWRVGEKANVVKGQYGPELKEIEEVEEPF